MKKSDIKFRYKQYAENAILIQGPSEINEILLDTLNFYKNSIQKYYDKVIVEVISSYNSLLIYYRCAIEDVYSEILALKSLYFGNYDEVSFEKRVWEIPVCYSSNLTPDIENFSMMKSMPMEQIVALHTAPLYTVFFIGFLPGFMYLGGLPEKLYTPRKKMPDLKIEKGSVAIGGHQTGIYPSESPGGWHVIGKSPLLFFNPKVEKCCFVTSGDKIKFVSIEENEYNDISILVNNGFYDPKYTFL